MAFVKRDSSSYTPRYNEKISDADLQKSFISVGAKETAARYGMTERSIYRRRANNFPHITPPTSIIKAKEYPQRPTFDVKDGCVIIGSDFHIWPGAASTSLRAFKLLCKELKPKAVILNGDVLDFPKISHFPPIGWEDTPTPVQEIEAAQDHLNDIEQAAPRGAHKIWTLGNHDARFETRLASVASEYAGLKGIHLSDHFQMWEKGWSVWINNEVVVKHRWKGGIHANYNNTVYSGKTIITGHLHSQKITPFTDYNGTRYGIDTGCVADVDHKAFVDYTEDNPLNWRSGFVVLNFRDSKMLYPELVTKWSDDAVQFRGDILKV